jgi:hypothetical protein
MWEGVRLCGDHYHKKQTERGGQLQREQQARSAAIQERQAKEQQEQYRAKAERQVKLVEAWNQIPGLLAQLRASRVPREKVDVTVRGKWRQREGWLLFENSREGFMGFYVEPYHVTTEGEFITRRSPAAAVRVKNLEAGARMMGADGPHEWCPPFDWIMIADRLRELLSGGG